MGSSTQRIADLQRTNTSIHIRDTYETKISDGKPWYICRCIYEERGATTHAIARMSSLSYADALEQCCSAILALREHGRRNHRGPPS